MKLLWTTALFTGIALATTGPLAALEKTLSGVEVKTDLSAFADNNALKYWPALENDLAEAIASQVNVDDGADAPRISVEINKVAIDGDTILPDSGEFNQLHGTVTTYEGNNNQYQATRGQAQDALIGSYALRLRAATGDQEAPIGWITVTPSKADFYNALIAAYATKVVERLEDQ